MRSKLHFAMSTKAFKNLPLGDSFRAIASIGIRHILLDIPKEMTIKEVQAAKKDFSQLGLRCIQAKSSAMPISYLDEKHYSDAINQIKELSEILNIYGGKQIELTAGSFRGKKEEHIDAAVKFIKEACDITSENGQYCCLDFTPKKNQLIKTWEEMAEIYEKVEKVNLLININTALVHHIKASDEDISFLNEKSAIIEIEDLEDDSWSTDINLGEGIVDITSWVKKTEPYIHASSRKTGELPIALLVFKNSDSNEINRTLKYFEKVLPKLKL